MPGKRLFDLAVSLPGPVALAPLLGLLALPVQIRLGSPVLFHQLRPGAGRHACISENLDSEL